MILAPSLFFDFDDFILKNLMNQSYLCWELLTFLPQFFDTYQYCGIQGHIHRHAFLENESQIEIGPGTIIEPGAYIKGPCIIGKESIIRHGAYIRGSVVIGDHCVIGHGTEIKKTIFMNRSKAAHFAYLGNSIIGNDVNLGAGVKCANIRIDQSNIKVKVKGLSVKTGLKKLGAIIGDGSFLGCNVVTNPGTFLLRKTIVYPGQVISGFNPGSTP
ncbi:Uncharacterized protein CLAVI_000243 [Candidatus Clavichlamydia salmonicola]|uniref:hypothetical protein n=1 Tax=Candidatus Clavichlamydia salmonicola TaxID=469812 RepID=UPI00189177D8|nr:hypothetical protein [Candidatus Clavichlamydia salmonicola]MBF5050629.1 Uncharacterized protein [Candidatus Clavichlamydia salmonicola]